MDEISATIASAIEEQGASTGEISNNSQQAAAGTQQVSENIAAVNQAATETGAAASQVLQSAGELSKQGELLRAEVDKFLAEVRAA
jgi:methyl-accepting chemotaxis protein